MKQFNFLRNRPSIKFLVNEAITTFKRFPFVLLAASLTAAISIYCLELEIRLPKEQLLFTLALGIPLFFATTMYRESRGWNQLRHQLIELACGAGLLGLHYWLTRNDETGNYLLKYFQLSVCLHLLGSFVAFTRSTDENEFWQFNRHIFLRILLSGLYAFVFFGGLSIGLITTDKLFSLEVRQIRFAEIWMISFLVLQTWHFLAGVPKLSELKTDRSYPKGLRFFVQYLLIPLVSLYTVILYCYMAKILFTWNWPKGYIGWLVSIMSVLGIFNLLLISPEKNSSENRWISIYSKAYYILILPLLGMLSIAIGKRVAEYGVTEQRYFLFVLGALLTGLAIYFIFSTKKSIKVIPISLFIVGILSLWGPWGAYDLSMRNQKNRATQILLKNNLIDGETTKVATVSVSKEDQKELTSIFDYLLRNHGSQAFGQWFPSESFVEARTNYSGDRIEFRNQRAQPLMEHLGLKYIDQWNTEYDKRFAFRSDHAQKAFDVAGFQKAASYYYSPHGTSGSWKTVLMDNRELLIGIDAEKFTFVVKENSKELISIPLDGFLLKMMKLPLPDDPTTTEPRYASEEMLIEGEGGNLKVRMHIQQVNGELVKEKSKLNSLEGLVLFK